MEFNPAKSEVCTPDPNNYPECIEDLDFDSQETMASDAQPTSRAPESTFQVGPIRRRSYDTFRRSPRRRLCPSGSSAYALLFFQRVLLLQVVQRPLNHPTSGVAGGLANSLEVISRSTDQFAIRRHLNPLSGSHLAGGRLWLCRALDFLIGFSRADFDWRRFGFSTQNQ
ncbi:MAG: hypothetical protein JWM11_4739 [Planctomycetaceae bacterium]|nr:hypothetical protein [Planctomycetaceae bacterium]